MNRKFIVVVITIVCYLCFHETSGLSLNNALQHFEILEHDTFRHHIMRRDLYSKDPEERQVEYKSYGRNFHLILHKISAPLYSTDLRVIAINEKNEKRLVNYEPTMYHGYLADEPRTSSVSAYFDDEGTLTASVNTSSDIFVVEPAWRHISNASNHSMISYRGSDLRMEEDLGDKYCGYARPPGWESNTSDSVKLTSDGKSESRVKRDTSCTSNGRTTCTLLLVADYRFYKNMGLGNIAKTTSYLFMQIDNINAIYQKQQFGVCDAGFRFEIKEIRIHESPTNNPSSGNHYGYNVEKGNWDTTGLLESFSVSPKNSKFCLAHLYTAIAFESGTLGLSYVASSSTNYPGGICSKSYEDKAASRTLYLNTGWSSSLNRYGRRLLTLEAYLVTAHEFGHNWGSEHDPDSMECSPSASSGGKYIMYTYSVSGLDPNNKIFSPCSRRSIGAVLLSKAATCFKQPSGSFCGNSVVEKDEQCDAGAGVDDKCCNSTCHLRPNAKCSDVNVICCDNCQYANRTKTCAVALENLCLANATCSGNSTECLKQPPRNDGERCLNGGRCVKGKCVSVCEYNNKDSCVCDSVENSCKWCCRDRDDVNKTCKPYPTSVLLPDGMPCIQGFCNKGVCERQVHDSIQRFWDIIENITVDKLVLFMRANIVGTVIILSLVIWIPASCVVSCIDHRRDRRENEDAKWYDTKNSDLIQESERQRLTIRRVDNPKLRKNLRLYIPPRHNH